MITYKIHLIRCGQAEGQDVTRYVGRSHPPLSEIGKESLLSLMDSREYPKAGIVYTSPLLRCVQTADILYPNTYTVQMDGLTDLCLGEFEGKTFDELKDNAAFSAWLEDSYKNPPPGGELITDFAGRVTDAIGGVFSGMMEDRVTSAAVITHRGVIATLLSVIGLPKHPVYEWVCEYGCGYTVLMTTQMWMRDGAAEVFATLPTAYDSEHA